MRINSATHCDQMRTEFGMHSIQSSLVGHGGNQNFGLAEHLHSKLQVWPNIILSNDLKNDSGIDL